jgi:diacylglycerol O-acyltransferase / wax synthase
VHRLSPLDASFLLAESRETPMHVGGLYLLTLPEGADEGEYLRDLLSILRSTTDYRRPFGHRLKMSPLGVFWEPDDALDVEYHVRHSALPKPGRYRELFALSARLHQSLMDRHRPLWEVNVIEGLANRQFAVYSKIHHAAVDGVGGVRLAKTILSEDPNERREDSPFSQRAHERLRASMPPRASEPPTEHELKAVAEVLRESFGVSTNLAKVLKRYVQAWLRPDEHELTTAWNRTPPTSISSKISGARRFVAQSYDLARVKAVGKALGGTINDVVLAMCGGALRSYLLSRNELPDVPLTALTPVSLRREEEHAANAVGALTANLATHVADPEKRFQLTRASMLDGKDLLRGLNPKEVMLFTQLTAAPALLVSLLGLGDRFPPFSTVISNVPGPRARSYWNGARLDGMYPVSAVYHGFAMNITLLSNADQLDFGVVACRRSVPSCQRIIDDLENALRELEEVAGFSPPSR